MKLLILLIFTAVLVVVFRAKAALVLPKEKARDALKNGALLIDVRTTPEFTENHLPNAVNIPLDELKEKLPRRVTDKSATLLLHCQSGRRSAIAEGQLRALGYTNAVNIGSFEQARQIVTAK